MKRRFEKVRRQQFLSQAYYKAFRTATLNSVERWRSNLPVADDAQQARSLACSLVADELYQLLAVDFTAGADYASLRPQLEEVIQAYERYQQALAAYEGIPQAAPLGLGRLDDYERCMQLIGLCYLLHRRDLLPRIAALEDPAYAAEDVLYEELLSFGMAGRYDVDMLKFVEVYDPLIQAMYAESDALATDAITRYVNNWYPWFKLVPWHDGHLRIKGTDGDYFGYWAFEAGAVALLCEIDDSSIDHMVYPKDLVAWARQNQVLSQADEQGHAPLRCLAGQPCVRDGFWFTPASPGSQQRFTQGQVMPDLGGAFGATVWQWAEQQDAG